MSIFARLKQWATKQEPVIAAHVVAGGVAIVGEFLVGDTHLLTSGQWSTVAMGVTPLATAAVATASAVVMRRFVSPALSFGARLEATVEKRLNAYLDESTVTDAAPSADVTDLDVPDDPPSDVTDVDAALASAAALASGSATDIAEPAATEPEPAAAG